MGVLNLFFSFRHLFLCVPCAVFVLLLCYCRSPPSTLLSTLTDPKQCFDLSIFLQPIFQQVFNHDLFMIFFLNFLLIFCLNFVNLIPILFIWPLPMLVFFIFLPFLYYLPHLAQLCLIFLSSSVNTLLFLLFFLPNLDNKYV